MAVLGSGDDLFLKVTIDNQEVARTKESLTNLKRFISTFVDSFASEPEAGLLIVDSLLEDFQVAAPVEQRHELEP
ncbi:hypothetical protein [Pseudomonas putida]|uniref:hypothetical protein n=1 Tax=Pseudomonas putida TaxID=303 RepID=UPI001F515D0B|nr:hypothetical protein [Pseudomonas putida]MCI1037998.1 hypothetical protein [Pseudomonas putida]